MRVVGCAVQLMIVHVMLAGEYDLPWNTVDGGAAACAGSRFRLVATVGQPDAPPAQSRGQRFGVDGGYWPADTPAPCSGAVLGDSSCDGTVSFDDIDCFVAAMIGPDAWRDCGGGEGCDYACVNDVNDDGVVDFNDIDTFVECLINSGCP